MAIGNKYKSYAGIEIKKILVFVNRLVVVVVRCGDGDSLTQNKLWMVEFILELFGTERKQHRTGSFIPVLLEDKYSFKASAEFDIDLWCSS